MRVPHPPENGGRKRRDYGAARRAVGASGEQPGTESSGAKEAAEKHRKAFLQGLKPIGFRTFTPGLKPRPPKEKTFSASCEAHLVAWRNVGAEAPTTKGRKKR